VKVHQPKRPPPYGEVAIGRIRKMPEPRLAAFVSSVSPKFPIRRPAGMERNARRSKKTIPLCKIRLSRQQRRDEPLEETRIHLPIAIHFHHHSASVPSAASYPVIIAPPTP